MTSDNNRAACIFCGRRDSKLTKEHIFGKWLRDHLPESKRSRSHYGRRRRDLPTPTVEIRRYVAPLSSTELEVRVVCEHCNHGWMEKLERRVEPFLVPLLKSGDGVRLSWSAQRRLATWAYKTAAMIEFLEPKAAAIPEAHHRHLCLEGRPPPLSTVWMGAVEQTETEPWTFHWTCFLGKGDPVLDKERRRNVYAIGFLIGQVAFIINGTGRSDGGGLFDPTGDFARSLRQVHPLAPKDSAFNWPPGRRMSVTAFTAFCQAIPMLFGRPLSPEESLLSLR